MLVDADGELGEGDFGVALGEVLHGEAVAGEGVGGIEQQDFVERGEFVHGEVLQQRAGKLATWVELPLL